MSLGAGQHKATVTIDARVDSADRQIRKLTGRLNKYERELAKTRKTQSKAGLTLDKLEGSMDKAAKRVGKLSKVMGGAGLASAAGAAVVALDGLVQKSIAYQNVMANLPFAVDKAKAASMGLVSSYELAKAATQANRLGVVKTAEDFAQLTEAAVKLGLSVGEHPQKAIEDLTLALGRGSAAVLDNLGISLKAAEAQREYAKRLGVSVSALSDAQKAEAFRKIGLERALVMAAKQNITLDEGARKWNETKNELIELGQEWLPEIAEGIGFLIDVLKTYFGVWQKIGRAIDTAVNESMRFLELDAVFDDHVTSVRGMASAYEEVGMYASIAADMVAAGEESTAKAAAQEKLLRDERARSAGEAATAGFIDAQQKLSDQYAHQLELRKAQGATTRELAKLADGRALAELQILGIQGKEREMDQLLARQEVRRAKDKRAAALKGTEQAKALRAAESDAAIADLAREAKIREANGRDALVIELQILELKRSQALAERPRGATERIRHEQRLLDLASDRKLLLIEIEQVTLEQARERERTQLEAGGGLEVARLRQRAELLGRTTELAGESWTAREQLLAAELEALDAQLELRRELVELQYGDEVQQNAQALVELEAIEHERKLSRIAAEVKRSEWANTRANALVKAEEARIRRREQVIGQVERSVQTAYSGTSRIYDLAAKAQGKSAEQIERTKTRLGGVQLMIEGAVETGKGMGAIAAYNYPEAALHFAAAAFDFVEGGIMLSGQVPSGGSSGGGSAGGVSGAPPILPGAGGRETSEAPRVPESVSPTGTQAPPAGTQAAEAQTGGGVTINVQALGSVDEAALQRWGPEIRDQAMTWEG